MKIYFFGILAFACISACSPSKPSENHNYKEGISEHEEVTDPGEGFANNLEYTNEYFRFTLPIPEDWHVELSTSGLGNANKNEDDDANFYTLCTMKRYRDSEVFSFNPSILVLAENVSQNPEVTSGEDYLNITKTHLIKQKTPYLFTENIGSEILGGLIFETLTTQVASGFGIQQKYYCAVHDGYALIFIITYNEEIDKGTLLRCLYTLNFY